MADARRVSLLAIVLATVLGLVGCADTAEPARPSGTVSTANPGTESLPARSLAESPIPLPTGFLRPSGLFGNPGGAGAFFLAESDTDARVFLWDGNSVRKSWSIGNPQSDPTLFSGIQSAIGGDGSTLWIGVNDNLIKVDLATGRVATVPLPAADGSEAIQRTRPAPLQDVHPITAIAVSKNHDVAVLRDGATDIELLSASTHAFSRISAGPDVEPTSAAFNPSGVLAVSGQAVSVAGDVTPGRVDFIDVSTGTVTATARTLPGRIASLPTGEFILRPIDGGSRQQILSPDGSKQLATAAVANLVEGSDVVAVSEKIVATETKTGLVIDTSGEVAQPYSMPRFDCSHPAIPMGPPGETVSVSPGSASCDQRAVSLATDAHGNLWALGSGPGTSIFEVPTA